MGVCLEIHEKNSGDHRLERNKFLLFGNVIRVSQLIVEMVSQDDALSAYRAVIERSPGNIRFG
jgi:hypothetical protein